MFLSHYHAHCQKKVWHRSIFEALKGYAQYTAQTKHEQAQVGLTSLLETPFGDIGASVEVVICWLAWHRYGGPYEVKSNFVKKPKACKTLLHKLSDLRAGLSEAGLDNLPAWARSKESYGPEIAQAIRTWAAEDVRGAVSGAEAVFGPILAPHARTVANDFLTKNPSSEAGAHVA